MFAHIRKMHGRAAERVNPFANANVRGRGTMRGGRRGSRGGQSFNRGNIATMVRQIVKEGELK